MTTLYTFINFLLSLFLQLGVLLLLYGLFRLVFRQELGWKLFYALISFSITFIIGAFGGSALLTFVLRGFSALENTLVVRDGNSFVVLLMELSFFWTLLLFLPMFFLFFYSYVSAIFTKQEQLQL